MPRFTTSPGCYRLLPLLLLPGCLVSFNDYPLGATSTGTGGAASSGGSKGGKGGSPVVAGSSSGGKTTSAGTSSGDAGAEAAAGAGPSGDAPQTMIDDFEDGDKNILEQEGRRGAWYAGNDGQGVQAPPHGSAVLPEMLNQPRGESRRVVRSWGGPFGDWGALIGTALASEGEVGVPYDVSGYQGVRFWVRYQQEQPVVAKTVRVQLPTTATNDGGACSICNDHFGADVPLSSQWQQREVRFSELSQAGFGFPPQGAPNLEQVTAIQFGFPGGVSFDLWLDDVEFF